MNKKQLFFILNLLVSVGLLLLLVRENEGRTAAEEKLRDMNYKVSAVNTQKDSAITELYSQIHDLEVKLQDARGEYEANLNQKKAEIEELNSQMKTAEEQHAQAIKDKEAELSDLDAKAKADKKKFSGLLQDKNAEIADLSKRAEESSAKITALLKKIEKLEAQNLASDNERAALAARLKKAQTDSAGLSKLLSGSKAEKSTAD